MRCGVSVVSIMRLLVMVWVGNIMFLWLLMRSVWLYLMEVTKCMVVLIWIDRLYVFFRVLMSICSGLRVVVCSCVVSDGERFDSSSIGSVW